MSGETHRDDELDFNDDFVLEDAVDDLETLFDDPPAAGVSAEPTAKDAPDAGEDQVLFGDTPAAGDPSKGFTPPVKFTEAGGVHWKGFRMSPDEIGIPTDSARREEAAAASQLESHLGSDAEEGFGLDGGTELELVDDERQLNAAPAEVHAEEGEPEAVPYVVEDAEGQLSGAQEAEAGFELEADAETEAEVEAEAEAEEPYVEAADADADDSWAPLPSQGLESGVPSEDSPYIEGEAAEEEGEYTGELLGAATADADEQYYVEAPVDRIGAPERRRSMRWLSGLVAALLLIGAGAAFFVHPEWFGMGAPQLDNRVQIARPRVDLEVAPPEPLTPAVTPGNTDPDPTQPGGHTDPQPVPGGQGDPEPIPPPVPTPAHQDPTPVPGPIGQDPAPEDPAERTPLLPAGDLLIGGFDRGNRGPGMAKLPDVVAQILPGSNAFVQLRNGNFFIGRVKAVDAKALTMRVSEKMSDKGEVNLSVDDITRVASLGTSEYNDLLRATSGFIKLTNSNRLVGSILESVADDYVILEMKSNRILVPKSAIEEIGQNSSGSVGFARGTDEDQWVRRLAEQKLKDLNRRARLPSEEDKSEAKIGPEKPVEDKPRESAPR